jgi:serine/threonine-protein kinase
MGEVFEAAHLHMDRRAAVKVLLPELSHSEEAVARFFNEARAVEAMRHESLVRFFDYGMHANGSAYIAMELLSGKTLAEVVDHSAGLPVFESLAIARKLAAGMASAHACGVLHRDLKPENVIILTDDVDEDGIARLKIIDFGIAKLARSAPSALATRTGNIMGTPAFMSPEQCHGAGRVDERSDIYSLGCILYFMLTGRPPFVEDGVGETIAAQLYEVPVTPGEQVEGIPAHVDALVMRLLEKSRDDRPETMQAVEELLAGALISDTATVMLTPPPEPVRRPRLATLLAHAQTHWGIAAGLTVALASATMWGLGHEAGADNDLPPLMVTVPVLPPPPASTLQLQAAPVATPTSRPTPATIAVRVTSKPAGAEVVRGDKVIGETPLDLALEASDQVVSLSIRKHGYLAERVSLPGDRDGQVQVVLTQRAPQMRAREPLENRFVRPKGPVKDGALDPFTR